MKLKEIAKKLPLSPGVYRWLGAKGEILYIGRATSLRRRVLQYFRPDIDPRIGEMVSLAKDIKFTKTDTVLEAIILEANLIKKYWPKYNVMEKDDKSFTYVVFPKTDWSKPLVVRGRELSKFPVGEAKIFGPFLNATLIKNTLKILRRIFPYSTCQPGSGKPCFDYQIGSCPGACVGTISQKDYQKNIANLIKMFEGKKKQLAASLAKTDSVAAAGLKHISDAILISRDELGENVTAGRIEAYDISHFAGHEAVGAMSVFVAGVPDKTQYRLFNIHAPAADDLRALEEMIDRRLNHGEWPLPDIFLIDGGKPQINYLKNVFAKHRINRPIAGLSKLGGDELVFSAGTPKAARDLAAGLKRVLQQARDEAHRFGNAARKRKMSIKNQGRSRLAKSAD